MFPSPTRSSTTSIRSTTTTSNNTNDNNDTMDTIIRITMDDWNEWSTIMQWLLRYFPPSSISNDLRQELLLCEDEKDDFSDELNSFCISDENDKNNNKMKKERDCLFYGVPRRPLYREVAYRLLLWNQHQHYHTKTTDPRARSTTMTSGRVTPLPLLLPAEHFGFHEEIAGEEQECPLLRHPPPPLMMTTTKKNKLNLNYISKILQLRSWLSRVGDNGILRLLGMRRTIGTTSCTDINNNKAVNTRITPSRKQLLHAACQPYHTSNDNNPLTVAARARTKHAHRCRSGNGTEGSSATSSNTSGGTSESGRGVGVGAGCGGYFGTIQGNATYQNQITKEILVTMIQDATWINIHTFGGRDYDTDGPVVEIRVSEGYGARWQTVRRATTSTTSNNTSLVLPQQQQQQIYNNDNDKEKPSILQFRGFLEPQMEDGHEKKWRH